MHQKDLLSLSTASMARINELAAYCNLRKVGTRGVWWVRKSATSPVTRKEYFFKKSMGTADLRTAVIRALPQVEDFLVRATNPDGPLGATSGEYATLGQLFAAYRAAPTVKANEATRERNVGDFKRLVKLARGDDFDVELASTVIIAKPLAKDYQSRRLAAAGKEHGDNLAALEATKRAINSTLKHAQSLFSREAMDDYGAMRLPATLREFAEALPVPAKKAAEPAQLQDGFVQGLMAAMTVHKAVDAAVWVTFQLFVWGGLRNIECLHARRGWLEKIPAGYRLQLQPSGDFLPKGRNTSRVLPGPIVEELLALVAVPADMKDEEKKLLHLVPALNVTDRHDAVYRRLNDWLRDQGVGEDAGKIAYRLRKYFFKKVEEQQGLMLALAAHGGGQLSTLTDHYIGIPRMAAPITLAK
jgi:hypothetical protein